MKKFLFFLLASLLNLSTFQSIAQGVNFELMGSFGPHEQVKVELDQLYDPMSDVGDVDGDGDLDIIIAGETGSTSRITKIYLYNGSDSYDSLAGIGIIGVLPRALRLIDLDGDSDLDVFIAGITSSNQSVTRIYTNDGTGGFTQISSSQLPSDIWSAEFGDLDNDGDVDLVLSTSSFNVVIFDNDSNASFSLRSGLSLPQLKADDIELADINYDSFIDIVYAGSVPGGAAGQLHAVYNDSNSGFTSYLLNQASFLPNGGIKCANYNGDSLMDILYVGDAVSGLLLLQDSTGVFSLKSNIYPQGVLNPTIYAYDRDGDGDEDILVLGVNRSGVTVYHTFYDNYGDGSFSPVSGHGLDARLPNFTPRYFSSQLADFNGDGELDILGGRDPGVWDLYHGHSNGKFYHASLSSFGNITAQNQAVADFNSDGALDIVVVNYDSTRVYFNSGTGTFPTSKGLDHFSYYWGDIATGDFDNDGDEDIVFSGSFDVTKIFWNNGSGDFSSAPTLFTEMFQQANIEVFDVDNDADLDILVTGASNSSYENTALYINNGSGQFVVKQNSGIPPTWGSTSAQGDIDLDGDIDLVLTGSPGSSIYLNDGQGVFTTAPMPFSTNFIMPFCELVDFNGDSLPDMFASRGSTPDATIFENLGDGSFAYRTRFGLLTQMIICDANHDGFPDILTGGKVYVNDGPGNFTFTLESNTGIRTENSSGGLGIAADFDGDTDDDIFYASAYGYQGNFYLRYTQLYRNMAVGLSVVENTSRQQGISPYPNPMVSDATVDLPEGTFSGQIIEVSGRIVRQINNASGNLVIEREGLNIGAYVLVLTGENGESFTTKFLVQ